jgi:hypothetical protein
MCVHYIACSVPSQESEQLYICVPIRLSVVYQARKVNSYTYDCVSIRLPVVYQARKVNSYTYVCTLDRL